MMCTNKFDMCKSNNKSIYHHALFLFGMAIHGFTMAIINEKTEPARALFFRPLLSLWAFDTQRNEMAQPELSFNLGFFLLRLVLSDETEKTKSVQN